MVKCAVVGLGIGMAHVAGYLKSSCAELVAVCDLDINRLEKVGGTFSQGSMLVLKPLFDDIILEKTWEDIGVKTTTNIKHILNNPEIDIVSLCTPDYTHESLMIDILESGKHLLLEKPVSIHAINLDILQQKTARLCEEKKLHFVIGYEFRCNPAILYLKYLVDSGTLGDIKAFSLYHYRTPFRRDKWNKWIQKKEFSGGLLVEETCHWFDLARYITGKEGNSIHAISQADMHSDFDYEDIAYVQGTYEDGSIWQISHALTGFDFNLQITVHGTKGTAWCALKENNQSTLDNNQTDYYGIVVHGFLNGSPKDSTSITFGSEVTEPENIQKLSLDFADAVDSNVPIDYAANFLDGRISLEWALKAGQSIDTSGVIQL